MIAWAVRLGSLALVHVEEAVLHVEEHIVEDPDPATALLHAFEAIVHVGGVL